LLLIDERAGTRVAREKGLWTTGTLGLLDLAAERGLVDFGEAIRKLELTSFRRPEVVLKALPGKHNQPGER
jgi:predicted nucleic acid-binding protein